MSFIDDVCRCYLCTGQPSKPTIRCNSLCGGFEYALTSLKRGNAVARENWRASKLKLNDAASFESWKCLQQSLRAFIISLRRTCCRTIGL
jgi:hypothetical protein